MPTATSERTTLKLGVALDDKEGLYFITPDGQRLTLNYAPKELKARSSITPSSVNQFQLEPEKAPTWLVFLDKLKVMPTADEFTANVIGGNGRLALLEQCWKQNIDLIAQDKTDHLWAVPEGIWIEYLTEQELNDPQRAMLVAAMDNASKVVSPADMITSISNIFNALVRNSTPENKAISRVASLMNLTVAETKAYLDSGDNLINFPFLADALQDDLIKIGMLNQVVKAFYDLQVELPEHADQLILHEMFQDMKEEAYQAAGEAGGDPSKSQPQINRKILNSVIAEYRSQFVDASTALEEEHAADTKERAKKAESAKTSEKKRIKDLKPLQVVSELTQAVFRLSDTRESYASFLGGAAGEAYLANTDKVINITGNLDNYKPGSIAKMLQEVNLLLLEQETVKAAILDRAAKATELLEALPVRPPKAEKKATVASESIDDVSQALDSLPDKAEVTDQDIEQTIVGVDPADIANEEFETEDLEPAI